MCGISGFCNLNQRYLEKKSYWEKILTDMHACLSHRGNDASGTYLNNCTGLSHARLSIRDIAKGNQPMVRHFPRGEYAIVYNGEIYNAEELLPALKSAGYFFETTSDTEVILYSYIHYGKEFVSLLNGIFSFAIWDGAKEELFLYRDRVGVKPLFYTIFNDTMLFGSEPKALFTYPGFTPAINENSLQEIFAIGPARTSGNGIFANVKEVLPGHYLCFAKEGLTDRMYWDIPSREHTENYADTVERTGALVRDAITRQMVSDVPVCTFLSGGIDSSIVTAVAANYMKEHGETLNTFSFDFTENDIYFQSNSFQPERDLPYVNKMLEVCATNHTYLECDQKTLYEMLFSAVDANDGCGCLPALFLLSGGKTQQGGTDRGMCRRNFRRLPLVLPPRAVEPRRFPLVRRHQRPYPLLIRRFLPRAAPKAVLLRPLSGILSKSSEARQRHPGRSQAPCRLLSEYQVVYADAP